MDTPDLVALPKASTPAVPRDHFVQFYERDAVLVESVSRHLRGGLEAGAAAIAIATPEHVRDLLELWDQQGFDPAPARESGQLVILDAADTLEQLLVDGWPQQRSFEAVVGALVERVLARFGTLVAFGEMVALLWSAGRQGAAIHLEGLWNTLAERHKFSLLCAYQMSECGDSESIAAFREVCQSHSHVVPAEDTRIDGDPSRLIAELQQKAASLEEEVRIRRRVEGMLADRERELSDFLDNAVMGLHKVGPDGTILWANRAELAMIGCEAKDYIGRNIADFHVDKEGILRIIERLSAGETLREHPAKVRCRDGSIRHVLISSNALLEDGRLVSTRCFTQDVTDRWYAQEALRERGAVLHLAMQGARMGYWVGDLRLRTLRLSQELASLLGLAHAFDWDLDGFIALIHPEDRKLFRDALFQSIEGRGEFLVQFRVRRDLADWRWFEGRGEPVYDDTGRPMRFYGVCMDITSNKREEQMLAHLAAVVDSAEDAIVSKTLDGIVTSWNQGATRIFGYEAAEMIGRPITVLIPPELHHEEAQILSKIRAGERVEHYRTTRRAKDGSPRTVSLRVSPVRDPAGRIVGASKIAREVKPPVA